MTAAAQRIRAGPVFLTNVSDIIRRPRGLSPDEESAHLKAAQAGDEAAELVLTNVYLQVILILAERYSGFGLELTTMMAIGQRAFSAALDDYAAEQHGDFPAFAINHINQSIWRALPGRGQS